ncbi:nitronate monooxygenase family protein [Halioxenophilus aromaticivorans]
MLNQRTTEGVDRWLTEIEESLVEQDAPFAVNLIVHKTNHRLEADLNVVVDHKVPIVITSLGAAKEVVDAIHSYGGIVFHDVTTTRFAEKALTAGVDGLIAVCAGAGGHAGTYNPFAFIDELKSLTDKPIIASGCISSGASILAAQAAGADLAYMGTRFIATKESLAGADYKAMLIGSSAKDIVYTPKISGVNANFLEPSIRGGGIDLTTLDVPTMNAETELSGDSKAWKDIWSAGQGVGAISDVALTKDIITNLKSEYRQALDKLNQSARAYR